MSRKIVFSLALFAASLGGMTIGPAATEPAAAGEFGRHPIKRGISRPSRSNQARPTRAAANREWLDSPEMMTKKFGPSILVRAKDAVGAEDAEQTSRFVTQP